MQRFLDLSFSLSKLVPVKHSMLGRINSLIYYNNALKNRNNDVILKLKHQNRLLTRTKSTNGLDHKQPAGITKKYPQACQCGRPPNIICMVGQLINCPPWVRQKWEREEKSRFLDSIFCSSKAEKEVHSNQLDSDLKHIAQHNFCHTSKTIDIFYFMDDLLNLTPSKNKNIFLSSTLTQLVTKFDCVFIPIVAVFLNTENGKRVYVESQGLSTYTQRTPHSSESYTHYIMHNDMIISFQEYKKIIIAEIACLTKDYIEEPSNIVFHVLKVGEVYQSEVKRRTLIKKLSLNAGVLCYDYYTYTTKKYVFKDLLKSQKGCRLLCNSRVSLTRPIHLGHPNMNESYYTGGNYKSVMQAAYINCLCKNQIVYGLFSNDRKYDEWYLYSRKDFHAINKAKLTNLNLGKIKSDNFKL